MTVLLRDFGFVDLYARLGIRIGAAADGEQYDRILEQFFKFDRGVASPIAADFVVGQHDAVAGIVHPGAANLAVRRLNKHHGQVVIDRSAARAPIDCKADIADRQTRAVPASCRRAPRAPLARSCRSTLLCIDRFAAMCSGGIGCP